MKNIELKFDLNTIIQCLVHQVGAETNFILILMYDLGSALLGLVGGCFGAAAPTSNEFKELRNEILNGVCNEIKYMIKGDADF